MSIESIYKEYSTAKVVSNTLIDTISEGAVYAIVIKTSEGETTHYRLVPSSTDNDSFYAAYDDQDGILSDIIDSVPLLMVIGIALSKHAVDNAGGGGPGTSNVFIQETEPISASAYIWFKTDVSGNVIDILKG